ncbi:MAG TPA: CHAT domain-containing protein, partial [Pirellulales bacterium]
SSQQPAGGSSETVASVSRAAYFALGGQLPLLPATAEECKRISSAFSPGVFTSLESDEATEKNVRSHLAGRKFIHLAAHGLIDQQNDNLFGAIALTPPAGGITSTDDDGFLYVNEIHNLPLADCQLAVLSACQTNVGPDRPLEAGPSIAQAFLAAGCRRVVCSHWSVDDASTAELIGGFFERLAQAADKTGAAGQTSGPIDYATAFHQAQLKVRSQRQWASPYYWAPFVLIGSPE